MPRPVACQVETGVHIDVSVAQFGQHIAQDFKELVFCHTFVELPCIFIVHLVPIKVISLLFVIEKAVMLVDDAPKGFEIAVRIVGKCCFVYTRRVYKCEI